MGGTPSELFVEFFLTKAVPIQSIWHFGWRQARRFVTALNMGSIGFFWWYIPIQTSRFYEKLTDIEINTDCAVERTPILEIGWPQNVLSESELKNTALCFYMLHHSAENESTHFSIII
jgi:hypothetical protein